MAKNKQVKSSFNQSLFERKQPRVSISNPNSSPPIWSFQWIDIGAEWCWSKMTAEQSRQVYRRLGSFETNTWTEIQQQKLGHPIPLDSSGLNRAVQQRLAFINRDGYDLYSIRITGAGRVWGIKIENTLYFLWWDPKHEVYPWEPINT